VVAAGSLSAQEFSYGIELLGDVFDGRGQISAPQGSRVTFRARLVLASRRIDGGEGPQGWSLSLANRGVDVVDFTSTGTATANVAQGGLESGGFRVLDVVDPNRVSPATGLPQGQGIVQAVVLSFVTPVWLPPNSAQAVGVVTYAATVGAAPSQAVLEYRDGLIGQGQPVSNDVTFLSKTVHPSLETRTVAIEPSREDCANGVDDDADGAADCRDADCSAEPRCQAGFAFVLDAPGARRSGDSYEIEVSPPEPGTSFEATVRIGPADPALLPPNGVQGWSYGVSHEGAKLRVLSGPTTLGTTAADVSAGGIRSGGFEKSEVVDPSRNGGQSGIVSAVVLSFTQPVTLDPSRLEPVLRTAYAIADGAGGPDFTAELAFLGGLRGSGQPVDNVLTVEGSTVAARDLIGLRLLAGEGGGEQAAFVRGNANGDRRVDIADAVWIINEIFRRGPASPCPDAADANDDGVEDVSDALFVIRYQFVGGPRPSAPFPSCGRDASDDRLGCLVASLGCP
jgi:hypothetical protein